MYKCERDDFGLWMCFVAFHFVSRRNKIEDRVRRVKRRRCKSNTFKSCNVMAQRSNDVTLYVYCPGEGPWTAIFTQRGTFAFVLRVCCQTDTTTSTVKKKKKKIEVMRRYFLRTNEQTDDFEHKNDPRLNLLFKFDHLILVKSIDRSLSSILAVNRQRRKQFYYLLLDRGTRGVQGWNSTRYAINRMQSELVIRHSSYRERWIILPVASLTQ